MGVYDRDYYRPRQQNSMPSIGMPKTIVGKLILINVVIFLVDAFTPADPYGHRWLSSTMAVHAEASWQPWYWWQMLTYGFAHSPLSFQHILFNMLALFFLGRDVEYQYGSKEFLRLYLVMIVFAALVWMIVNTILPRDPRLPPPSAYGASGAIAGIVVLYALNFPHRKLLLFFVIPVPAWLLGFGIVMYDALGAMGRTGETNVAYVMHLAGAFFAFVYFQQGWRLSSIPLPSVKTAFKSTPKLKVHDPEAEENELRETVDRLLEKITKHGEASLTRKERKTLQSASKKLKERRE